MDSHVFSQLIKKTDSLNARLQSMHVALLERHPELERIACALYDQTTDTLRTFIHSTRSGHSLDSYEYKLADSESLSLLARTGQHRIIDDLSSTISADSPHSRWLLEQGYDSSLTIPLMSAGDLLGFIFLDATKSGLFNDMVQQELLLHSDLIAMTIASEMTTVNLMLATVRVATDFARLRDFETGSHLDRMARLSRLIAKNVAEHYSLDDDFIEHIRLYAPLHDIGKVGVPDNILLKEGALNAEERKIMETHVNQGVEILQKILADYALPHLSESAMMLNIVAYHHEYLDGSGYPHHLSGIQIPIEAKIVTVADIFDALTCHRPYKQPWTPEAAMQELELMAEAGKLDKVCVRALRAHIDEAEHIITTLVD